MFSTTATTTRAPAARPPPSPAAAAAAPQHHQNRRSSPPTQGDNRGRRPPNTTTTGTAAASPQQRKQPSPSDVQQTVQRIKRSGAIGEVDALVATLKRTRQFDPSAVSAWETAVELVELMPRHGHTPNLFVFSGLLQVLGKARQPDKALHYFAEIERSGLTPNTHCFSALIAALGTAGRVDDAERHFAQMAQLGVVPNTHCFSAVIAALGTAGRVDDAERHFGQMAQLGVRLISGFAEAGRVDKAEHWFAKITTVGRLKPDLISYSALKRGGGAARRALELLHEMTHKGVRPDVVSLQHSDQQPGQSQKRPPPPHGPGAGAVSNQMVQQAVRPDATTFGALIHGHALVGDLETARRRLQEMSTEFGLSPNAEIHTMLMDAEQRMATDPVAAYHQVLRTVDHMKQAGVHPTHATFSVVIDAAGFAGLPHEAERQFDAMTPLHGLHPNTNNFTSLIEALARNGRLDKAEAVLDSLAARQPTSALQHDRLTAKSFNTLLGFCIGAGDSARGQRVVAKMHQAGVAPTEVTQAKLRPGQAV
ncbi:pentatricopeptide repeat domain containing protein [Acanthamoeba castellanii str. Neff]|uniref:Pentatricopeptide repeat domain containing protein n=1 Tax=Acanthamoeba castellanii (strain ATCC 30010 / Neff) TaxID=1257118 RepID=L8H4K3_ACACF|nr:pentatricopeptide repeat domain containing protein [Acanthamoeba castellanii str. Neff]ELR19653.1 pentatricopeptide repeat domain containing protein [Acanthamoeba castellanii str. Neff]